MIRMISARLARKGDPSVETVKNISLIEPVAGGKYNHSEYSV